MYNYEKMMEHDVFMQIIDQGIFPHDKDEVEELCEQLEEDLWADDSVTGNGGDFYADEETCRDMLRGNEQLYMEAAMELGSENFNDYCCNPRAADCTVRCYLLRGVIYNVLNDLLTRYNHMISKEEEG